MLLQQPRARTRAYRGVAWLTQVVRELSARLADAERACGTLLKAVRLLPHPPNASATLVSRAINV